MRVMLRLVVLTVLATVLSALSASAQTVTPQLAWNTSDALAKVSTYTTTLQIGTGAVATITPVCAAAGTGASCTVTGFTFNANAATTFRVVIIDPATGQAATGTLNYAPGTPPASFTLTMQWQIKVP